MAIKLVIDTNVLVSSLSSKSKYHWLIQALFTEQFELYLTNEILLEYEEILHQKYSIPTASGFIAALKELPNTHFVYVFFYWNLLRDPDDNKFVDCYVSASADYLVTADKDFNKLLRLNFPKVRILSIDALKDILAHSV